MSHRKLKVLVAEDDAIVREAYSAFLDGTDAMEVRATADGFHAAQLLKVEAFDAVILDVRLPNMNGLQVAAIARSSKANRGTPLFVVTGSLDAASRKRAAALGGVHVYEKPYAIEQLVDDIVRHATPKPKPAFDARIINAVLAAAADVLGFYLGKDAVRFGKPAVGGSASRRAGGVAGLVGIGGASFAGSLAFAAPHALLDRLAVHLLPGSSPPLSPEAHADLMGEVTNQICGRLKSALGALGVKASIGLPEVILGADFRIVHKADSPVLSVPLVATDCACAIELCLSAREGLAADESKGEFAITGVMMFE